jgi:hypothetical protein
MKKVFTAVLTLFWLLTPLFISGCNSPEVFAIYLTKDNIPVSKMPVLSHVDLASKPVISTKDIISYEKNTHEIELTTDAYERVMQLEVPTTGKAFVVCVHKAPIYWGAFWTPISSQSFDGVTIWVNLSARQGNTIKIGLGYPSEDFFRGDDPRSSPEIIQSLEKAGKLK